MPNHTRASLLRYGVVLLTVGLALLVTPRIDLVAKHSPLALFLAAVIISSWYGGRNPGLLALALSASGGIYLILRPLHPPVLNEPNILQLSIFILLSLLVNFLISARRHAEERQERAEAEEALRQAEEKYRSIFENAVEGIYQSTPEGRFISVNPAHARMLGYDSPEELIAELTDIEQHYVESGRRAEFKRLLAGCGVVKGFESEVYRRDGSKVWISENVRAVRDGDGLLLYYEGTVEDITERKQAEEALKQSERDYRGLFEQAHDAILVIKPEGEIILDVNERACKIYGFSRSEFIGMSLEAISPDVSRGKLRIEETLKKRDYLNFETVQYRKDGTEMSLEVNAAVVNYKGQRAILSINRDITERVQAEQIRLRQTQYAALRADVSAILVEAGSPLRRILQGCAQAVVKQLDAAFARIWLLNAEENVLELQASAGMYTHLDGAHSRVTVGALKIGLIAETRRPHLTNEVPSDPLISDREWAEREMMVAFAGHPLLVEQRLVGVIAMFARRPLTEDTLDALASVSDAIAQGIERKRVEEALRDSEEWYRDLVEHSHALICTHDLKGRILSANLWAEKTLGYGLNDLLEKNIRDVLTPEFRDEFDKYLAAIQRNGSARGLMQVETAAGERRIWEYNNTLRTHGVTSPVVRGMAHDITERKLAAEEVRRQKEIFQQIFDNVPIAITFFDEGGRLLLVNRAWERMFGWTLKELDERNLDPFVECLPNPQERRRVFNLMATGAGEWDEFKARARDGRIIDVWASAVRLSDGTGIGLVQDITERKRAEEERAHLLRRLVTAQEDERYRIARELHDHVGQYLAALMLRVKSLKDEAQATPRLVTDVTKLEELIHEFSREMRGLALDLRPPTLDDLGLSTALSNYIEQWSERNEIAVDFHSNGLLSRRFSSAVETALYRMIQEALNNILKHSEARHVSLVLEYRRASLRAVLDDDGCGFNVEAALSAPASERGLGLIGMRERIESVGGTLDIESSQDAGTTLVARIPVKET